MTFSNSLKIKNNTINTIRINFNQYLPNKNIPVYIVYGSIKPLSSTTILFKNNIFYQDGIKMEIFGNDKINNVLYGNMTLAYYDEKTEQLSYHPDIKWFDTKNININSDGIRYTDNLDIDPIFSWIKKNAQKIEYGSLIALGTLFLICPYAILIYDAGIVINKICITLISTIIIVDGVVIAISQS
jgi:hypothetical protein